MKVRAKHLGKVLKRGATSSSKSLEGGRKKKSQADNILVVNVAARGQYVLKKKVLEVGTTENLCRQNRGPIVFH